MGKYFFAFTYTRPVTAVNGGKPSVQSTPHSRSPQKSPVQKPKVLKKPNEKRLFRTALFTVRNESILRGPILDSIFVNQSVGCNNQGPSLEKQIKHWRAGPFDKEKDEEGTPSAVAFFKSKKHLREQVLLEMWREGNAEHLVMCVEKARFFCESLHAKTSWFWKNPILLLKKRVTFIKWFWSSRS